MYTLLLKKLLIIGCSFKEYYTLLFEEEKHRPLFTRGCGYILLHDIEKQNNKELFLSVILIYK